MLQKEHKRQVIRALEKELVKDRHKTDISEVSALGLVQMTRKRNQESLGNSICRACPTCDGRGKIKSIETVCLDIIREIYRSINSYPIKKILILSSASIIDRFVEDGSQLLDDLSKNLKTTINFQVESCYTDEQFDVVIS
jgi:ribonuclease G